MRQSTVDWEEYREELRAVITDPESNILLKAEGYKKNRDTEETFFELTSRFYTKKYCSLWELFDEGEVFQTCMDNLAQKAREIREKNYFTTIITSTKIVKEFASYIKPVLDQEEEVTLIHLGDYPSLISPELQFSDFADRLILILTDVVASSTLIKKIAGIVKKRGGKIAGALSVLLTNPELIAAAEGTKTKISFTKSTGLPQARTGDEKFKPHYLHFLADYRIDYISKENNATQADVGTKRECIKIDPISGTPPKIIKYPSTYRPYFKSESAFNHFKHTDAIEFGFFKFDKKHYTVAFRYENLFSQSGTGRPNVADEIWLKVKGEVLKTSVIVTSFERTDILLANFIKKKYLEEKPGTDIPVITIKREIKDAPHFSFTLDNKEKKIAGKHILLALSSVTSSERMRSITSLLVTYSVKSIQVLCLVNRMGIYTTDFVTRIRHLFNGYNSESATANGNPSDKQVQKQEADAAFRFFPVYNFLDLNHYDIARMHETIKTILKRHIRMTTVPNFKRLGNLYLDYFKPKSGITKASDERKTKSIPPAEIDLTHRIDVETTDEERIIVNDQNQKMCALSYSLALNRHYTPLIDELRDIDDRISLFHVLGLLLADIEYINFINEFARIKRTINGRIKTLREERFEAESKELPEKKTIIKHNADIETYLIFALSLLSYYDDSTQDYSPHHIIELIFCGKDCSEWETYPLNRKNYLASDRLMYAVSLMLFGVFHNFNVHETAVKHKEILGKALRDFTSDLDARAQSIPPENKKQYDRMFLQIRNNFDLLLREVGIHNLDETHKVIRFLHVRILKYKPGHNPINTNLRYFVQSLDEDFFTEEHLKNKYSSIVIEDPGIIRRLDSALSSASILQVIADALKQFYRFTTAAYEKVRRYIQSANYPGFAYNVNRLDSLLTQIRNSKRISMAELGEIDKIRKEIHNDFYSEGSQLRKDLQDYVVSPLELLAEVLKDVNGKLREEGYGDIWQEKLAAIQSRHPEEDKQYYVLCDYHLLKEIFRNLLYNIRHGIKNKGRERPLVDLLIDKTSIKLEKTNAPAVRLTIENEGQPIDLAILKDKQRTIVDHRMKIREYGGSLEAEVVDHPFSGTRYTLTLLSREGFARKDDFILKQGGTK